jgi:hypothetical protein
MRVRTGLAFRLLLILPAAGCGAAKGENGPSAHPDNPQVALNHISDVSERQS